MKKSIEIKSINKWFRTERGQDVQALKAINLDVCDRDFVCFVGPSGCGKSTLLRIIAGLEHASEGSVLFSGMPIREPDRNIGMVFQEYSLLPWRTVVENVILGLEFRKFSHRESLKVALDNIKLVGLEAFSQAYPYELSGGMQQRVAIARALANDPQVLLMDEPFGALDAHTRILLQKELLRIWESNRKTILFVTHSVDEAIYLADRIVVMSAHPGTIREIIEIDMPRPRERANPVWGRLVADVLKMLEEEVSSFNDTYAKFPYRLP